uniref:Uncharacterized protein n=1 Tax=Arundo donax TaxID=35708 RepID=A0A0A9EC55_ARUDO
MKLDEDRAAIHVQLLITLVYTAKESLAELVRGSSSTPQVLGSTLRGSEF